MGPTCIDCERRYPECALHESCADARIYEEGGGWLLDRSRWNSGIAPTQSGDGFDELWWRPRRHGEQTPA